MLISQNHIVYKDTLKGEQIIATFWTTEAGNIHGDPLSDKELKQILKISLTNEIYSYPTGNCFKEEE